MASVACLGSPGPLLMKSASGIAGKDLIGICVVGKDVEIPVPLCKTDNHILFHTKIKDRDSFSAALYMIRLFTGDFRDGDDVRNRRGPAGSLTA